MTHTRRNFTKTTKREAFDRSNGICECHRVWQLPTYGKGCGRPLTSGNTFYEHIEPDRIGGLNDLDNAAVLTKTCWQIKTSSWDRPTIDKSRRQQDRARGIRSASFRPITGSRDSNVKLQFNGPPIDRRTELPWGTR